MTRTSTLSPTLTTASGASTCWSDSSEMWTSPSMPSATLTKAPNGTSFVTSPGTIDSRSCSRAKRAHGSSWVFFSERLTRSRWRSTSRTSTSTSSPTSTTSEGWSMCFHDSSETWTSPSTPPRSTNAPKLTIDDTTPARTSPGLRELRKSLRNSLCVSSRNLRRERTTLLRLRSSSMILHSSVWPMNGVRSRTRRISTSDAGRNPRRPMSTMRPPLTTSMTLPWTVRSSL